MLHFRHYHRLARAARPCHIPRTRTIGILTDRDQEQHMMAMVYDSDVGVLRPSKGMSLFGSIVGWE